MTKSLLRVGYKDGAKWVNEDANSTQFIAFGDLEPFQQTRRKLESAGGTVLDYDPHCLGCSGRRL